MLEDGRVLEVANVIWCTGFNPGFSWIDLPAFGEDGEPLHRRGVGEIPGLYFVGLHFLYSLSSAMVHGAGRDAGRVVRAVAARAAGDRDGEPVPSGRALRQARPTAPPHRTAPPGGRP